MSQENNTIINKQNNQEKSIFYSAAKTKDYFIAYGEMIGTNLLVYDFNALVLEGTPVKTNFKIFLENLQTPWIWDYSGFGRNQIIHPYIGSSYFNCARANNLNFAESLLVAVTGSFLWETYFEGPISSVNDFITTPVNGAVFGEILHRLSFSIYDYSPFISWILSPFDAVNELLRGQRSTKPIGSVYKSSILLSTGLINSIINFDNTKINNNYYPSIGFEYKTVYGNPFGHKTKELYDQFTFNIGATGAKNNYGLFFINCDGILYSTPYNYTNVNTKNTIGLSLNYDIYKSTDILLSNSALGFTNKNQLKFLNIIFDFNLETNYIFLSTSDNYYLLSNYISKIYRQPNYTFKHGPQLKINFNLSNSSFGNFYASFESEYLINYKNSCIDKRFESNALILFFKAGYEHRIYKNIEMGIQDLLYIKNDYIKNDEICSTKQLTNFVTVYLKYNFINE